MYVNWWVVRNKLSLNTAELFWVVFPSIAKQRLERDALLSLFSWCLVMVVWLLCGDAMGLSAVCDCGIS